MNNYLGWWHETIYNISQLIGFSSDILGPVISCIIGVIGLVGRSFVGEKIKAWFGKNLLSIISCLILILGVTYNE